VKTALLAALACTLPNVARAEVCSIDYVNVPGGVTEVIEGWVAAEPRCRGRIALRVIPTKDGYFLFAERPDGTVHERLVPDLTAAGVLVASWVADSWRVERPRKKKKRRAMAMRAVAVDEAEVRTDVRTVIAPEPALERKRWLSLGGTFVADAEGADVGFRLETDLVVLRGWRLGVAVQKVQDTMYVHANESTTQGQIDDWSAGAIISHTLRWRGWELRGGVGAFVLGSKLHTADFYSPNPRTGDTPYYTFEIENSAAFELSASLARDIGDRWGVALSAATMFISQPWLANDNMTWYHKSTVMREEAQLTWVVSLRRRI
jgi:hypothetical protein